MSCEKKYFVRIPFTQLLIRAPRKVYNKWPWAGVVELGSSKLGETCTLPANDGDIEGIYKYLCWRAKQSGEPSDVFHYLAVLRSASLKPNRRKEDFNLCVLKTDREIEELEGRIRDVIHKEVDGYEEYTRLGGPFYVLTGVEVAAISIVEEINKYVKEVSESE